MESKKNDIIDNKLRWDLLPLLLVEKNSGGIFIWS